MEENISGQSPSGRLIAKLFSPTRETPGDYVFMGLNPQSPGPIEPQLDSLYVTATSPTMGIADLNISEIVLQSPSSGYMMMSSPSTTTSVVKNAPEVCGEEIWLEQKIMVGVCPIQDDSVITPRSTEEAEEDPFCVVEIGAASRELTGEKAASALYENLIIPEVTVGRIQSTVSSDYGVVGTGDKDGIKKDEWKVPSVNRPLVRPSSVALDKPETSSFLNLSQSPRGRSSLTLSDRPAEKVMVSYSCVI